MRLDRSAVEPARLRSLCAAALAATFAFAAQAAQAPTPPTFVTAPETVSAPTGTQVTINADGYFDNPGTNPQFTDAVFSTTDYYDVHEVSNGVIVVQAKTAADLNAMQAPPSNPFTVSVEVTMTNDAGQTASGTIDLETTWAKATAPGPAQPVMPTFADDPATIDAPSGVLISVGVGDYFNNPGTNPKFTAAVFSTTDYYDVHEVSNGEVWVKAKTAADLNAMQSPPSNPFTVTVDVTMTNDGGQTATGTLTFETTYVRSPASAAAASAPAQPAAPTFSQTANLSAPPGQAVTVAVGDVFDNAGTNPRFTSVAAENGQYLSSILYSDPVGSGHASFALTVETAENLRAKDPQPPSPFTTDVTVTMTNDANQTASGTLTFETTYALTSAPTSPPRQPTFSQTSSISAPPGQRVTVAVGDVFDNAGTNPRFTRLGVLDGDYIEAIGFSDPAATEDASFTLTVSAAEDLNAKDPRPPSPFTSSVKVTMTNDAEQSAEGTLTFETTYTRTSTPTAAPTPAAPTFSQTARINAPPGQAVTVAVGSVFANAGTNPRFTTLTVSNGDDISPIAWSGPAGSEKNSFTLTAETAATLNARPVSERPPSPFTTDVTAAMTNDAGQTASGTITFETTYTRATGTPAFAQTARISAPPGKRVTVLVADAFDHAGTNARVKTVKITSGADYLEEFDIPISANAFDRFYVQVKTTGDLNAMDPRPPAAFTVTAELEMINDEDQTAKGTITFQSSYLRATGTPAFAQTAKRSAPPGILLTISPLMTFTNAGTNPKITSAVFSTTDYYSTHGVSSAGFGFLQAKTIAELNAMDPRPPSPFTVDVAVTMTNDEGQTASGTITFETTYPQTSTPTPTPPQSGEQGG